MSNCILCRDKCQNWPLCRYCVTAMIVGAAIVTIVQVVVEEVVGLIR